jgi:hypothetical protein
MKAEDRRVEKLVIIFCFFVSLFSACNSQPDSVHTKPETVATTTARVVQKKPIPATEATPTQELESLEMKFGAGVEDFPLVKSYDVEGMRDYLKKSNPDGKYQYILYTRKNEFGYILRDNPYKAYRNGESFLDRLENYKVHIKIEDKEILEKVMAFGSYSEEVNNPFHQEIVLVTEETGEDGITRNGFFSYSEYGIAIYIKTNGAIYIYDGDYINVDDPEVRSLFEQRFTQVRIVNGKPKGFFNINDLPSRILASMK